MVDEGMDPKDPYKRCADPADPNRCQSVSAKFGQCNFYRVEHGANCHQHGGQIQTKAHKKEELEQYRLGKYKARVTEFASNPKVLSLRDEIGIVRMLLETKLNRWQDPDELISHSTALLQVVQTIHKIVMDCKKLESQMGMLMDRAAIQRLCDGILGIMSQFLDEDQMGQVATLVMGQIAAVTTARVEIDDA